jgi:hypothetical protein
MFDRFCVPYYTKHAKRLHACDKVFLVHMDGRLRALKETIARCPIDGIESFSLPEIGGDLTLAQAIAAWPDKLVLPNFPSPLATQNEQTIKAFLEELLGNLGSNTPFMLQVSEDIPPGTWQNLLPLICRQFGGAPDSSWHTVPRTPATPAE